MSNTEPTRSKHLEYSSARSEPDPRERRSAIHLFITAIIFCVTALAMFVFGALIMIAGMTQDRAAGIFLGFPMMLFSLFLGFAAAWLGRESLRAYRNKKGPIN